MALARALINKPTVLLLDEPLAALDRKLRREMQIELQNLQREVGITFVLVTHDQEEALSMSDSIAIMRDGRIVQFGSARDLYDAPVNRYVADFVGESNFIPGEVVAADERPRHHPHQERHHPDRALFRRRPCAGQGDAGRDRRAAGGDPPLAGRAAAPATAANWLARSAGGSRIASIWATRRNSAS